MWLLAISVLSTLFISAFCSLMEASLLSLKPSQVAEITARRPRIGAIWSGFKAEIERPISAILILNTAAHTIGASVAGSAFDNIYGSTWIWAFSLVFTMLMLQFTEILPKSLGVRYNRQVAVWIARPLKSLIYLLLPVVYFVHGVNRIFSGGKQKTEDAGPLATLEEITALAGLARLSKEISPRQERIIEGGTRLSSMKVRSVMRPRVEIEAIKIDTPTREVAEEVVKSGFSRLPVYKGNLDNILGFVYIKDVLRELYSQREPDLDSLLRPAPLVPGTLMLDKLLQIFHKNRTQMAVVLDEYGGTVGLVTMEDILEEFVGDIYDEHRPDEAEITRRDEGSWLANGIMSIRDMLEAIGHGELCSQIPDEVTVVGGLIQIVLDRIPEVGESAVWNGIELKVVRMENRRIDQVLVTVKDTDRYADKS